MSDQNPVTEAEKAAVKHRAKPAQVVAALAIVAAVAPLVITGASLMGSAEDYYESQTMLLRTPSTTNALPTYTLNPDGTLDVAYVTWRYPLDYEVTRVWLQRAEQGGPPLAMTLPETWGDVTTWTVPATHVSTGRHTYDFVYEISNGEHYRTVRVAMSRVWLGP